MYLIWVGISIANLVANQATDLDDVTLHLIIQDFDSLEKQISFRIDQQLKKLLDDEKST